MSSLNQRSAIRSISCPNEEGWVAEFDAAQKAVKKSNSKDCSAQLRFAIAAQMLRQWTVCQEASNLGLKLCSHSDGSTREKFLACQAQAKKELAVKSFLDEERFKHAILTDIWNDRVPVDIMVLSHPIYSNLNILHVTVLEGDVRLLEHLVASGASLDFPPFDVPANPTCEVTHMVHKNSTALVLSCAQLALITKSNAPFFFPNQSGMVECAVRLVMLGANTQIKLSRPGAGQRNRMSYKASSEMFEKYGFFGKTAYELAMISGHQNLINAMKELETTESRVANCHCRCGSRLRWSDCHGFPKTGESPYYIKEDCGRVTFRYSPLAPCHCGSATKKKHFDCCWKQSSDPHYQDDVTGKYTCFRPILNVSNPMMAGLHREINQFQQLGFSLEEILPPYESSEDRKASAARMLRTEGPDFWRQTILACHGPKSAVLDWDLEVYVGTFERLGRNEFHWTDLHWQLDKVELLKRVDEWNTALAQYCDDVGLTGQRREQVIQKHSANPCAPCANLSCTKFEAKCKEFSRCARCKRVSYCSTTCQRQHWKEHKKKCIPI